MSLPTPRRPPSPLAHGPAADCDSCRDCPSCDGGRRRIPACYRVELHPVPDDGVEARAICTRCGGRGTTCLNLIPDLQEDPA